MGKSKGSSLLEPALKK
jgi:hypothetical protein